ncbi:hypothetical protein WMY93_031542 [Mugilogobius chulae]|uniref:Protein kinase domain-containing protein n=1 Tax=Mugilogobius chulae TaxID=88201 RepID=A0AAW0MFS2_9GOBI
MIDSRVRTQHKTTAVIKKKPRTATETVAPTTEDFDGGDVTQNGFVTSSSQSFRTERTQLRGHFTSVCLSEQSAQTVESKETAYIYYRGKMESRYLHTVETHNPMDLYEILEVMGEGSYGEVCRCRNKLTGKTVAVKRMKYCNTSVVQREVSMLQKISCLDPDVHNVVRFHRHFTSSSGQHYLEFEQLDQTLHDLMRRQKKGIPLNDLRPVAKQLLTALEGLRALGIVHTDIKPDNIMLVDQQKEPFRVKLIDFGLARLTEELRVGMRMQVPGFRAPEVSLGLPLSEAVDVWSLGCCLLAFYLYLLPFDVEASYDNVKQISHILGVPDERLITQATRGDQFFVREENRWRLKTPSEVKAETGRYPETGEHNLESVSSLQDLLLNRKGKTSKVEFLDRVMFLDLIQKMLTMDIETRITPAEALEHPFITRSYTQEYLDYFTESEQRMSLKPAPEPRTDVTSAVSHSCSGLPSKYFHRASLGTDSDSEEKSGVLLRSSLLNGLCATSTTSFQTRSESEKLVQSSSTDDYQTPNDNSTDEDLKSPVVLQSSPSKKPQRYVS